MAIPPKAFTQKDFPEGFLVGSASSAFQCEGAPNVDGRGPGIWDTFFKENCSSDILAAKGPSGVEFYYGYKEDIERMKVSEYDTFRFSIAWPRILPSGRRTKGPNGEEQGVNKKGIDFYNNVINFLLENGIEPNVTLFHWDFPQALETEYLGFLSKKSVDDFVDYADLCFREFGDRVNYWMTFNETWTCSLNGYLLGTFPPGRGSTDKKQRASMASVLPSGPGRSKEAFDRCRTPRAGDPKTEPYTVTHNQLLAHAATVKIYRKKYQKTQKGKIGLGLVTIWTKPHTNTQEDRDAAQRVIDFMLGWLLDPVVFGKYPESMRRLVGSRLPEFTPQQAKDLLGSFDFIGLKYYTTNSVENYPPNPRATTYNPDSEAKCHNLGQEAGSSGVNIYPSGVNIYHEGFVEALLYLKKKYKNPILYITENAIDKINDENLSIWQSLDNDKRVCYHTQHLQAMKQAISKGVKVKGYFTWSLIENLD